MDRLAWRYDEQQQSFMHCDRRAFWSEDENYDDGLCVVCSKCLDVLEDNYLVL